MRITPAYAGKSRPDTHWRMLSEDHPRVCGEKNGLGAADRSRPGSPPRMRGKECCQSCAQPFCGITPAYAGKSWFWYSYHRKVWDHPRVCGEKSKVWRGSVKGWGSPPRMRGKESGLYKRVGFGRITPAYAGKRKKPLGKGRGKGGSPPRMRGKGRVLPVLRSRTGITPAYARKSVVCLAPVASGGDHPRVCGEKYRPRLEKTAWKGITPAYAGKSLESL